MQKSITAKEFFLSLFCMLGYSIATAQTTIISEGRSVSCILPQSICEITDTKESSDKHYIGTKIEVFTPSYAMNGNWYNGGAAAVANGGTELEINNFKLKVLSEPSLPTYPICKAVAETPANSFGFAAGVDIQILALGAIDKARYADAAKYVGEVYKTYSALTPIGGCWYAGIIKKGTKIFLFPCIQVKKFQENETSSPAVFNEPVSKPVTGKLTDTRDGGSTYHTVQINQQTWLSENLDVTSFRNGDIIPHAETPKEWEKAGKEKRPAWCYYNNDKKNDDYGKLYNWYAVNDSRGLAPEGWHIPGENDWKTLVNYLGNDAAKKMKEAEGWTVNVPGCNESGFSGLPGGSCTYSGVFSGIKGIGIWWSSTEDLGNTAWQHALYSTNVIVSATAYAAKVNKGTGLSVRCIKD
jgi:uncharacterized protein (TIGR02145 family)